VFGAHPGLSSPPQEKKEKKHKKHKREHKERKGPREHKRHRSDPGRRGGGDDDDAGASSSPPGLPAPMPLFWRDATAAAAAAEAVGKLAAGQPDGGAGVSALLSTLDAGEALVLEHVPDAALRSLLLSLCAALELEPQTLFDGSIAYSKRPGQPPLLEAFLHLLPEEAGDVGGGPEEPQGEEPSAPPAEPEQPQVAKRVFGAARPPPGHSTTVEAPLPDEAADEEGFGPRPVSAVVEAAAAVAGAPEPWWKRSAEAPKAPVGAAAAAGPEHREEWMTSLPTDRHGNIPGGGTESRQFARDADQIFSGGIDESWTNAPTTEKAEPEPGAAPARPMSLAQAAALAWANAASGRRSQPPSSRTAGGEAADDGAPAAQSLVSMHAELQATEKKAKKGKAEWEGAHPWKPWNRETDLDIRAAKPKGVDSILKNQHMGELGTRFGGGGRETTFM